MGWESMRRRCERILHRSQLPLLQQRLLTFGIGYILDQTVAESLGGGPGPVFE